MSRRSAKVTPKPVFEKPLDNQKVIPSLEDTNLLIPPAKQENNPADSPPLPIIYDAAPSSSIPMDLDRREYARQCKHAAQSSRLDPFVLHPAEYSLLRNAIAPEHITTYLNIRNGILRLWVRCPMTAVTLNEAVGCARHDRFVPLAQLAYEWLVRSGYINFGCISVPETELIPSLIPNNTWRPRIVIVGAGISGIGCARQLNALFHHFEHELLIRGILKPDVAILEGRNRIGGRMYSTPISASPRGTPEGGSSRGTVELGAQIVTGFDRGNPLNQIIRGQLGLHVHMIERMHELSLYDIDGSPDKPDDLRVDRLFNDILDRASVFKAIQPKPFTLGGHVQLINASVDPSTDRGETIASVEARETLPTPFSRPPTAPVPTEEQMPPAALTAKKIGWDLRARVKQKTNINLKSTSQPKDASLGSVVESAVSQYQQLIDISPRDLRVLNWHCANLEYSSAAPLSRLSLSCWDQDSGNEFEGDHANVIGGYSQVPWALSKCPSKLDIRLDHTVQMVRHGRTGRLGLPSTIVECTNGSSIQADLLVLSVPLGVLKQRSIQFDPPLPEDKQRCIDRLGFGLLNKVPKRTCRSPDFISI